MSRVEDQLREALTQATEKLQEQDAVLRQLTEAPINYGTVVSVIEDEKRVVVATHKDVVELAQPPRIRLKAGQLVRLAMETGQILGLAPDWGAGAAVTVGRVVNGMLEVGSGEEKRLILVGAEAQGAKEGDMVVLDASGSIAKAVLPRPAPPPPDRSAHVTWDDVGGLAEAKEALREAIELPAKHPELYERYGRKPTRGIMLYGPPGCGKTLLGKAAATALAKAHGNKDAVGFIYVKGPEVLSMWVGAAEARIRDLFNTAREHKATHGFPAVIFLDEADALLGRRGSGVSSDVERTIVPAFLAEMDGIGDSGAVVLLATNRQDTLDPAVVRDGRVDRKVAVTRPAADEALRIFNIHLRGKPGAGQALAKRGAEALYAPNLVLWQVVAGGAEHAFRLGDLASGALIAGVCEKAATLAMRREIASGKRQTVYDEDMVAAVMTTFREVQDVDHTDAIRDFAERLDLDVQGVRRVKHKEAAAAVAA